MIDDLSVRSHFNISDVCFTVCLICAVLCHRIIQKAMEEEEEEEEEKETKPDPLHQLILHFSRTALTEKRCEIFMFNRDIPAYQ